MLTTLPQQVTLACEQAPKCSGGKGGWGGGGGGGEENRLPKRAERDLREKKGTQRWVGAFFLSQVPLHLGACLQAK